MQLREANDMPQALPSQFKVLSMQPPPAPHLRSEGNWWESHKKGWILRQDNMGCVHKSLCSLHQLAVLAPLPVRGSVSCVPKGASGRLTAAAWRGWRLD